MLPPRNKQTFGSPQRGNNNNKREFVHSFYLQRSQEADTNCGRPACLAFPWRQKCFIKSEVQGANLEKQLHHFSITIRLCNKHLLGNDASDCQRDWRQPDWKIQIDFSSLALAAMCCLVHAVCMSCHIIWNRGKIRSLHLILANSYHAYTLNTDAMQCKFIAMNLMRVACGIIAASSEERQQIKDGRVWCCADCCHSQWLI